MGRPYLVINSTLTHLRTDYLLDSHQRQDDHLTDIHHRHHIMRPLRRIKVITSPNHTKIEGRHIQYMVSLHIQCMRLNLAATNYHPFLWTRTSQDKHIRKVKCLCLCMQHGSLSTHSIHQAHRPPFSDEHQLNIVLYQTLSLRWRRHHGKSGAAASSGHPRTSI